MIFLLWAAAFAAALAAIALNARAYTRRVNARWPAQGRFIATDGAKLHVLEAGPTDAPRVLLIHGASANLRELWAPLGVPLAHDHSVIAMDRPGLGHSTRPRDARSLAVQARCAARVLEQTGGAPAIIVGQSLGAAVALRLALDYPKLVAGLVLVAPACEPYPGKPVWWVQLAAMPLIGPLFCQIVPLVAPLMTQAGIANVFAPAAVPANYFEDAGIGLSFRPSAFRANARDVNNTQAEFTAQAPRYPEMFAPAIVITADKDRVVSPKRHARTLAAQLPAAELVIAPGAGHMPHRVRTDLVLAAIRRVQSMAAPSAQS